MTEFVNLTLKNLKMCFHNSIHLDKKGLEKKYKKKLKEQKTFTPIFHANAFEHQNWPIISTKFENIEEMSWGLVPSWATSSIAAKEIRKNTPNARIETISEKPSFKNAQRCLVPSSGFFEWQSHGNTKIPYFIYLPDSPIFSMAGLYDIWVNEQGEQTYSFTIVTTEANELMASIHNTKHRMPVILKPDQEMLWLNNLISPDEFSKPFDDKLMKAHTIGSIIGTSNHNSPEVSMAKTIAVTEQLNLF